MIERVTRQARQIVVLAEREARSLGSPVVGDEHFALAFVVQLPVLFDPRGGPGPWFEPFPWPSPENARAILRRDTDEALATLGISLDDIEARVESVFGANAWTESGELGRLAFSRDGRTALGLAMRYALTLRRRQVIDIDILAGVIETQGRGRRLLAELEVDVDELAERIGSRQPFVPGPDFR